MSAGSIAAGPDRLARVRARFAGDPLRLVLAVISALTVVSGVGQLLLAGFVLDALGAESTVTSRHFFAIVGMFMAVVGALLLQALLSADPPPYVVGWCGVQKLGAFVAVTVGVARDVFGAVAILVALFDLATAVLCAALLVRMERSARERAVGTSP